MDKNLLNLARKYQKKREWAKAIDFYERYMEKYGEDCNDKIYASYARCLRAIGDTTHAKMTLMKGKELYPKSERIYKEFYSLYDLLGDWHAAKSVANILIDINSNNSNYYFRLGKAYSFLSEYDEAKQMYISGLKHRHGISFERLIEKIQLGFTDNPDNVNSEYVFTKGNNNMGAFIHKDGDKRYFTKISTYKRSARREESFFKYISTEFHVLKDIAPAYVDSQVFDQVLYLTLEMIDGPDATFEQINDIVAVSQGISAIKYQDIIKTYPNPNYLFQMRNRPVSIVIFFTKIHKKNYNEKLFSALYKLIKQNNYPESVERMISRVESLIMGNHLYAFMKPEKHYSLLHGDFISKNMKVKRPHGKLQVFDWATFTTGPHFIDIARYLSASLVPYDEVKKIYLSNNDTGDKLSLIEKIFFLYALILLYLLRVKGKRAEQYMEKYMLPALSDLEGFVVQFNKLEYDSAIEFFIEQCEEDQTKLQQLKEKYQQLEVENNRIKSENKKMKTKLNNTLKSKSWRLTAPLRKVAEKIRIKS